MANPGMLDSDKAWLSRDVFGCGCGVEFSMQAGRSSSMRLQEKKELRKSGPEMLGKRRLCALNVNMATDQHAVDVGTETFVRCFVEELSLIFDVSAELHSNCHDICWQTFRGSLRLLSRKPELSVRVSRYSLHPRSPDSICLHCCIQYVCDQMTRRITHGHATEGGSSTLGAFCGVF
jgi:hypothetical protein